MPLYIFKHPEREEYVEQYFHMNDEKIYTDREGVEWKRHFLPVNLAATYRSFDEKKLVDENGQPLRVAHLTDDFVRSQGFENAQDYIDANNTYMVNPEKTPEAVKQKFHDQEGDKSIQEYKKEQIEQSKKATAVAAKKKTSVGPRLEAKVNVDSAGKAGKVVTKRTK